MSSYSKEILVSESDLDELEHVNNVRYVQWIQDISKEHWQKVAPKEVQDDVVWVVMSHYIEYKSAAYLGDAIFIKTHIKESKGAKSIRVVEMFHGITNNLILRSTTEWCLVNKYTQKPMRISEEIKDLFS